MLVVGHWGLRILLGAMRDAWPNLTLRLYVNDWVPSVADVLDNYAEASFPGYSAQLLNRWTLPFQVRGATYSETDEQPHVFTQTSPPAIIQTVYGYMVTSPYPHLLWAERAPTPQPMLTSGQQFIVRPTLTLTNQT